ncbi:hypothetical protein [Streptomyces sp. NPDC088928]|uniref:hypothetical protein n=1 Tax=Streptomyces sp. NPDC088928 TaxID=3365915 RepID=UPI0037FA5837
MPREAPTRWKTLNALVALGAVSFGTLAKAIVMVGIIDAPSPNPRTTRVAPRSSWFGWASMSAYGTVPMMVRFRTPSLAVSAFIRTIASR